MNFQLITEHSPWFIPLCLLLGGVYAFALYYREHSLAQLNKWLRILMATFRFVLVSILAFLLLSPMIKTIFREVEKPIVIVAQDNSKSILITKDSAYYHKEYPEQMNNLIKDLQKDYDVKQFSFGDGVKEGINYSYSDLQTNISQLFEEIYNKYYGRNVGAIIMASDGLYNQGSNPVYSSKNQKIPVYTIALGDTTVHKDLILSSVFFNKIVYLGNDFPLQVNIDARECGGSTSQLTVSKDSTVLFRKQIDIANNNYHASVPVILEAKTKGIHHYKVKLSEVAGEITTSNNEKDVFIEVMENKQKILLIANSPHPDLSALKQSIESNENYEVKTVFIDKFDGNVNDYNAVILHQIPANTNPANNLLLNLKSKNIPVWYILGTESSIGVFNSLSIGLTINDSRNKSNDAIPVYMKDFSLFTLTDATKKNLAQFPPLVAPFGSYKTTSNIYPMLQQQIGSVKTDYPLLFFKQDGESKLCVLACEGLWKWRLTDYMLNQNHESFNEIITKIIQFLSVRDDKSKFRVYSKHNYSENEVLQFDAEVFNDSYELINTPEVHLEIINQEKKNFPFTFSKTDKAYTLKAGYLPVGDYSYNASVKVGDKTLSASGVFSVSALQVESNETIANHSLLFSLAKDHGGAMVYPKNLNDIAKMIAAREDIKSVSYEHKQLKDLINLKWVFFLLLALVSLEWFLRKRSGSY